jgi:hypothetical protein
LFLIKAHATLGRIEARFFSADDEIFPARDTNSGFSKTNTTPVTSLSIRI